jgi:hypothetical protein
MTNSTERERVYMYICMLTHMHQCSFYIHRLIKDIVSLVDPLPYDREQLRVVLGMYTCECVCVDAYALVSICIRVSVCVSMLMHWCPYVFVYVCVCRCVCNGVHVYSCVLV